MGITRREMLKRGALTGGALLWATPAVQAVSMIRSAAAAVSGEGERLYARAYSKRSSNPGFDPAGGDVLIAKLVGAPGATVLGAGATVITSRYPLVLSPAGLGDFGQFQVNTHVVASVLNKGPNAVQVETAAGEEFRFDRRVDLHKYTERGSGGTVQIQDFIGNPAGGDVLDISTGAPSAPSSGVPRTVSIRVADDPFINVDVIPIP